MSEHRRPSPRGLPAQTSNVVGIKPNEPAAKRGSGELFFNPGNTIPNTDEVIYFVLSGSVIVRRVVQTPHGPKHLAFPPSSQGDALNEGVIAEGTMIGGSVTRVRDKEQKFEYVAETHVRVMALTPEQTLNSRHPKYVDVLHKLLMATIKKKAALEEQVEYHYALAVQLREGQVQATIEAERENERLESDLTTAHDKVARLERDLAASQAREHQARENSAEAFRYIEGEHGRQAHQAAVIWKQLEKAFARMPTMSLTEDMMSLLLGLDPNASDPLAGDLSNAFEMAFNEALSDKPEDVAEEVTDEELEYDEAPETVQSRGSDSGLKPLPALPPLPLINRKRLPTIVGAAPFNITDEDTEIGVGLPGPVPTQPALHGLAMLSKGGTQPRRTMTPVGMAIPDSQIPHAPPPPVVTRPRTLLGITAPASRPKLPAPIVREEPPDIQVEEVPERGTAEWGVSPFFTPPKK